MFEKYDSVIGTTTGSSSNGTFVELAQGVMGWIGSTCLPKGIEVICSVSKVKEDGFIFLNLDSVLYPRAA